MTLQPPPEPAAGPSAPGSSPPDVPPDTGLDELAAVAALVCGVPIAVVSLSDAQGTRVVGRIGLRDDAFPLDAAFEAMARDAQDPLVLSDVRTDPRLAGRTFACGDGDIRFCAAVPLRLQGQALGLLCVADHRPRLLGEEQRAALRTLGELAGAQLDLDQRLDELARAQAAASQSDERFRIVARATVDAVWDWDLASGELRWNDAVTGLFGYALDEVAPTVGWWSEHIHPEEREHVVAGIHAVMDRGGTAWHDEYRFRRADGEWAHIDDRGYVIRDAAGQPLRMVGAMHDVTGHRRTEHELQRMRSYLKNIIDSMPSVLVGVDDAGRITEWNASAERATGIAPAQAVGRPFVEVLPEYAGQMHHVRRALRERVPVRAERQLLERGGEALRYVDVMTYPLTANGAAGAVIRVDDVSERVRIEQMMVQTEKMMSVGGLAAGMAHEINNPLGVILQSCQNLRRRLGLELPANRRVAQEVGLDLDALQRYLDARGLTSFVEAIQDAGERAGRIVADMLAFSRRAESSFAPERVDAMLDAVVRLAASDYDLKKKYDFKQIEVVRHYDPDLPSVPCARTEIEQVLLNLVKNAAQAMAEGGARPSRLVLRTAREGDVARIDIEDNGPGIETAAQRRIFEPFYTTKPVGVGTGLGLSVSYFIITDHHQGSLVLESTAGEGTCFTIRLPLRRGGSVS
jgi:PAS domain S-box-containing protein